MPKSRQSSPKDEILRLRCSPAWKKKIFGKKGRSASAALREAADRAIKRPGPLARFAAKDDREYHTEVIRFRLPADLKLRIERISARKQMSVSRFIRLAAIVYAYGSPRRMQ